jgi:hypothetical protein
VSGSLIYSPEAIMGPNFDHDHRIPTAKASPHIDPSSSQLASSPQGGDRSIVYSYALQEAIWHKLWFATAPSQAPKASIDPKDYSISNRLEQAKVQNLSIPPIFISSGGKDDKVDPKGADVVVQKMREMKVEVAWDRREDEGHVFEGKEGEEMEMMNGFLDRWLVKINVPRL